VPCATQGRPSGSIGGLPRSHAIVQENRLTGPSTHKLTRPTAVLFIISTQDAVGGRDDNGLCTTAFQIFHQPTSRRSTMRDIGGDGVEPENHTEEPYRSDGSGRLGSVPPIAAVDATVESKGTSCDSGDESDDNIGSGNPLNSSPLPLAASPGLPPLVPGMSPRSPSRPLRHDPFCEMCSTVFVLGWGLVGACECECDRNNVEVVMK
jgi:hypothetical protein